MGVMRVQHIYRSATGLAEDVFVNTFHFKSVDAVNEVNAAIMVDHVSSFYNQYGGGQTAPIANAIASSTLLSLREQFKVYDVTGPPPHAPLWDIDPMPVPVNNGTPALPSEVALCLSYAGAVVPGANVARRRGRIYIGPLNTSVLATAGGQCRPTTNIITDIAEAGKRMQALAAADGWMWCVRSPTSGQDVELDTFWCDDAWDTQRRRGLDPTTRHTAAVYHA